MNEQTNYDLAGRGVCAKSVTIETDGGNIVRLSVHGGCPGWTRFVERVCDGLPIVMGIEAMRGIRCGGKSTSCPAEVARILESL